MREKGIEYLALLSSIGIILCLWLSRYDSEGGSVALLVLVSVICWKIGRLPEREEASVTETPESCPPATGPTLQQLMIFTDGSVQQGCRHSTLGMGAVIQRCDSRDVLEETYRTWSRKTACASSFRAEVLAILFALKSVPRAERPGTRVTVITDYYCLIEALHGRDRRCRWGEVQSVLQLVSQFGYVRFDWIEGHTGQRENEIAHALAYGAAKGRSPMEQHQQIPLVLVRERCRVGY